MDSLLLHKNVVLYLTGYAVKDIKGYLKECQIPHDLVVLFEPHGILIALDGFCIVSVCPVYETAKTAPWLTLF